MYNSDNNYLVPVPEVHPPPMKNPGYGPVLVMFICSYCAELLEFLPVTQHLCHHVFLSVSISWSTCTPGISGKSSLLSKVWPVFNVIFNVQQNDNLCHFRLFWFNQWAKTKQKSAASSVEVLVISYWAWNWPIRARGLYNEIKCYYSYKVAYIYTQYVVTTLFWGIREVVLT